MFAITLITRLSYKHSADPFYCAHDGIAPSPGEMFRKQQTNHANEGNDFDFALSIVFMLGFVSRPDSAA